MSRYTHCRSLGWVVAVQCLLVAPVLADHLRWGDQAGGPSGGSFEISYEKRLFEPMPTEGKCMRCASYLEVRGEIDEVDDEGADSDVTALAVGFRRYFFPFRVAEDRMAEKWRWNSASIFLSFGLGGYEVEPDQPRPSQVYAGWYTRAGLLIPLTHTCREVEHGKDVRNWFLDGVVSAVYNEIETPGANLDYASVRVGLRFIIPSKRDKARARNLLRLSGQLNDGYEVPPVETTRGGYKKEYNDPCPGL